MKRSLEGVEPTAEVPFTMNDQRKDQHEGQENYDREPSPGRSQVWSPDEKSFNPMPSKQGFAERLLQLGEIDSHDHDQGAYVFRLIEEIYPIESQIFARACDRLLDLLEERGTDDDELQQTGTQARLILGLTLVPFIRAFVVPRSEELLHDDTKSLEAFRQLARPWVLAQLKNSVAYIVSLEIQEHQQQSRHGGLDQHSLEVLHRCGQIIDQHGHRPEAASLVEKARIEFRTLTEQLARHAQLNPTRAQALSYLLSCTSGGRLKDLALAALILRGNSSPGAEIVANPLQLLDVPDVASLLNMDRAKVTSGVSKLRRRAAGNTSITFNRQSLGPLQLWCQVHPEPASQPKD